VALGQHTGLDFRGSHGWLQKLLCVVVLCFAVDLHDCT
jgi:hypothetical protein